MYFAKMNLTPQSVIDYYLGNEENFTQARTAVAALAALLLAAQPSRAAVARDGQVVMGTVLTVTVVAERKDDAGAMAKAAIDEARRWDDALTIWRDDGELKNLNRHAGRG